MAEKFECRAFELGTFFHKTLNPRRKTKKTENVTSPLLSGWTIRSSSPFMLALHHQGHAQIAIGLEWRLLVRKGSEELAAQ